jgi:hypothetical protein
MRFFVHYTPFDETFDLGGMSSRILRTLGTVMSGYAYAIYPRPIRPTSSARAMRDSATVQGAYLNSLRRAAPRGHADANFTSPDSSSAIRSAQLERGPSPR